MPAPSEGYELIEEMERKYPGFLTGTTLGKVEKLAVNMKHFERKSPVRKRIISKNFHRRVRVYARILKTLSEQGPHSFTELWNEIRGSRSTISSCLKGLREKKLVEQSILTRKYELTESGRSFVDKLEAMHLLRLPTGLSTINTPSYAHGTRQTEGKTRRGAPLKATEHYTASFYPRRGFVRIDESKPNVKAALRALLNPIYRSIRRTTMKDFEIEINLRVKGTITAGLTKHERDIEQFDEKMDITKAEEQRRPW
jgi:DNA-binding MarR family transcriptional regulator